MATPAGRLRPDLPLVVDHLHDVVFQTDAEGRWAYLNPSWETLTGVSPQHALGRPFADHVHPDDREACLRTLRALLARETESSRHELRFLHADGGHRWVETWARVVVDEQGRAHGTAGTLKDVTTRRATEAALRRRDAILEAVGYASTRLLASPGVQAPIPEVLARLGRAADVSRVYVFENHPAPDGRLLTSQRHEWAAPGVKPEIGNPDLQDLDYEAAGFGRMRDLLARGEAYAGLVHDFPEEERAFLEAQSIRSIAIVPIPGPDGWWGFMGFDDCATARRWSESELEALRAGAALVGAALERRRADEAARAQALTRGLVRRMLQAVGRDHADAQAMRELGRTLAAELKAHDLDGHLSAFAGMGLGRIVAEPAPAAAVTAAAAGPRYVFHGEDMLEYAPGARTPTCHLPLGFLEGAVAAATGARALGTETSCQSVGHPRCTFVVMTRRQP